MVHDAFPDVGVYNPNALQFSDRRRFCKKGVEMATPCSQPHGLVFGTKLVFGSLVLVQVSSFCRQECT